MPTQSNRVHDESDNESISDLLSPSDGYFAEGHTHPGDVLVPDPSQGSTTLDKEREAREELQSRSSVSVARRPHIDTSSASQATSSRSAEVEQPSRRISNTALPRQSSPQQHNTINESTPLIASAPPAYSPPEPGSPYHQHMRNGSVPGIHEALGRTNALFPQSQQDMGGESEALLGSDKDKKSWRSRIHNWWEENSYSVFKYIALTLALLAAIGFLVDLIMELNDGAQNRHDRDRLPDDHGIPSYCKIVGTGSVPFTWEKSRSWKLIHISKHPENGVHDYHVQTMGRIHIRNAPDDARNDIEAQLEYHYSSNAVASEMEFSREDNLLRVVTAGSVQNYNDPKNWQPCLYLNITVWVKPGLKQDGFGIATTTLGIDIASNYTGWAKEWVIGSVAGSVKSSPDANNEVHWGGRNIKIVTDAASIEGAFPLYDSLWLETSAGRIDTDLTLHPGQYDTESDALLTLKSSAGSIRANTPALSALESGKANKTIESIPKRKYSADVVARAGSINLNLVHGVRAFIRSYAGSVTAAFTPWLEPSKESMITIESGAGAVDITVKDSIPYKGQPLRKLSANYQSDAGHLTLRCPAEWEGHITGDLMTGKINVDWPGLQIIKRVKQGPFNHLEARKGNGDGLIKFTGASGSADLIGRGGLRYPNSSNTGEDGDHRNVIDDRDGENQPWPIFIPPLLKGFLG